MATSFAQHQLRILRSMDEESLLTTISKRSKRMSSRENSKLMQNHSATSKNTKRIHQQSVEKLIEDRDLWNEFRSDLSSSGFYTEEATRTVLHAFVSKKMKHHSDTEPSSFSQSECDTHSKMAICCSKVRQYFSVRSLSSSFSLGDESVTNSPRSKLIPSSEMIVEFDHSTRHDSTINMRASFSRRYSRTLSDLSVSTDDITDDDKSNRGVQSVNKYCENHSSRHSSFLVTNTVAKVNELEYQLDSDDVNDSNFLSSSPSTGGPAAAGA
uniref:Uncharacterized protein n=1 Tax=Helicotheca tamesis TaxID=374047 RepID=A0A7S2MWY1_9STRA|eukprot:CAMPEP_0185724128 /NCGR_PEP_ID=MMETSP1171-20130828/701_1 /TAXON_ID=374046 /ORGANISM="Helicotheca tamensis, Strain CCMP826" /LENGTH=268 /DNA_ID=CAMNT_0028391913 /DNA_START=42 /DNA_END=848 /DNA_ORIENTATION=-